MKGSDLVYARLICPRVRSISAKGKGIHSNRINRSAQAETGGGGCRCVRGRPVTRFFMLNSRCVQIDVSGCRRLSLPSEKVEQASGQMPKPSRRFDSGHTKPESINRPRMVRNIRGVETHSRHSAESFIKTAPLLLCSLTQAVEEGGPENH